MKYLIDTNVISETIKPLPNKNVLKFLNHVNPSYLYISVLSLGEIRKGIENIKDENKNRKDKLTFWLENDLINWFGLNIISVTKEIADNWGRISKKQNNSVSAIDELLAATCVSYNLKMVTRNTKDFLFENLEVINPWL